MKPIQTMIEQTLLRPDATRTQIEQLCRDARTRQFFGVCVNGCWVETARQLLEASEVKVVTVAGFPLGASSGDVKRFETEAAVDDGAHEIDMVVNIGYLKEGRNAAVLREIRDVVEAADERPVKVILETGLLTREEIVAACRISVEAGAQFVKTSTGLGPRGASVEDIQLMRESVGADFGIKASGGIREREFALALIAAGANRIGTSSGARLLEAAEH